MVVVAAVVVVVEIGLLGMACTGFRAFSWCPVFI